jgi:hypothetical protein
MYTNCVGIFKLFTFRPIDKSLISSNIKRVIFVDERTRINSVVIARRRIFKNKLCRINAITRLLGQGLMKHLLKVGIVT